MIKPPEPVTDPLHFWARTFIRLGLVLLVVGIAPMLLDFVFFNGGAALIGLMALMSVAPLGVVTLVIGLIMWGVWKARRR